MEKIQSKQKLVFENIDKFDKLLASITKEKRAHKKKEELSRQPHRY